MTRSLSKAAASLLFSKHRKNGSKIAVRYGGKYCYGTHTEQSPPTTEQEELVAIDLTINGERHSLDVDGRMPLLWALRDVVGLTGTKFGCGIAQCGACTVDVNGLARRACVTPVETVAGATVTTIEGLNGRVAEAVRAAWTAIDVPQCGYCQSGQIVSATKLLAEKPSPTDEDIDTAMAGNICRCATYVRIRQAIHDAADTLKG
jgi:isoquinoline 1-oxidoreductase alpha subunit